MKKLVVFFLLFAFLTTAVIASSNTIVYITKSGDKYHTCDCRYLKKSKIATTLGVAKANGYTPCSVCQPPTE